MSIKKKKINVEFKCKKRNARRYQSFQNVHTNEQPQHPLGNPKTKKEKPSIKIGRFLWLKLLILDWGINMDFGLRLELNWVFFLIIILNNELD